MNGSVTTRTMSSRSVWVFEMIVTLVVVAGIIYAANFRYALPLVYPAPAAPDYELQATLAYAGIAVVAVVAGVLTLLIARRAPVGRGAAGGVAVAVVVTGVVVVASAFIAAAP